MKHNAKCQQIVYNGAKHAATTEPIVWLRRCATVAPASQRAMFARAIFVINWNWRLPLCVSPHEHINKTNTMAIAKLPSKPTTVRPSRSFITLWLLSFASIVGLLLFFCMRHGRILCRALAGHSLVSIAPNSNESDWPFRFGCSALSAGRIVIYLIYYADISV